MPVKMIPTICAPITSLWFHPFSAPYLEMELIESMKANDDPRKTGTMRLVVKWKMIVPTPAEMRAIDGFIPVINGTRMLEPIIAKVC